MLGNSPKPNNIAEEQPMPAELMNVDEVEEESSCYEKVFYNDLLLGHISSQITGSEDIQRMQRTCRFFKNHFDNYEGGLKVLSIVRVPSNHKHLLKVSYEESVRYFELEESVIDQRCLANIMKIIPKDEIDSIQKLVIKGIESDIRNTSKFDNLLGVKEDFTPFLDQFIGLKHLELRRVDFEKVEHLSNSPTLHQLSTLVALDLGDIYGKDILKLLGSKLKKLHLTGLMIRSCGLAVLTTLSTSVKNIIVHLDNKQWVRHVDTPIKDFVMENFRLIPWYRMFQKSINLESGKLTPIKHCVDLTHLKLIKLFRENDEDNVLKTISELPHLPMLEKLTIDGYFSEAEIRKFIEVLKKCKNLIMIELRMRRFTENEDDWIMIIENIPKRVRVVKLDSITSDNAITALKNRCSDSLLNLELRIRDNQLSMASQKMVYEGFSKLRILIMNGNTFNFENIELLEQCQIPRIMCHTQHHESKSALVDAMGQYYSHVSAPWGTEFTIDWKLYKHDQERTRQQLLDDHLRREQQHPMSRRAPRRWGYMRY